MATSNKTPACPEAQSAHGDAGSAGLVQIGLPTGTRSSGFETTRRDLLSMLGFSLGAA